MLPSFVHKNPSGHYDACLGAYVVQGPALLMDPPRPTTSPTWTVFAWLLLAASWVLG